MSLLPRTLTLAPRDLPQSEPDLGRQMAWAVDRDYWLSRCHGFTVEDDDGFVGVVQQLEYRTRVDAPDILLVRQGRFRHRTTRIPTTAVTDIWPREHELVLGHRRAA